jgi:hypothetical protein
MKINVAKNIAKFVDPKSPRNVRLMAANGAIPLPPKDLLKILYILCFDKDVEIKKKAQNTLKKFSTDIIIETIKRDIDPGAIDFLIRYHKDRTKFVKIVILSEFTSDDTIAYLAQAKNPAIVEMISNNHVRLSRSQKIFNALMENPTITAAIREKLRELRDGFGASPTETTVASETVVKTDAGVGVADAGDEKIPEEKSIVDTTTPRVTGTVTGATTSGAGEGAKKPADEDEEEKKTIGQKIMFMSVSEKMKLATKCDKEARTILLRDSNKLVITATIKSPKITDEEILNIAKSKQSSDEALRLIVMNNEWIKNYSIKLALVNNPKTPPGVAIRFLKFLTKKDIKSVANSKGVSALIANSAKKIISVREKKK